MQPKSIRIQHFVFSRFYHFLLIPLLALLLDQINMINNPQRSPVAGIQRTGFLHYLGYFFRQLYIFELITFAILAILTRLYIKWFNLKEIKLAIKPIILFQLQMLPLFLISILIFGPVTNFFRYLFLMYPNHGWASYFPEFFMSFSMYFNYLFPILIWGYLLINIDLLVSYVSRPQDFLTTEINNVTGPENSFLQVIDGANNQGNALLVITDIIWFEVEKKNYYAYKSEGKFNIKKTLAELEQELNSKNFFRINRSQIINVSQVRNYSYWEFEKYIIRLTGAPGLEFVITRKRLKELKIILEMIKCV